MVAGAKAKRGEHQKPVVNGAAPGALLIVEDSWEYCRALERYFGRIYQIRSSATVAGAKRLLASDDAFVGAIVDVKLCDGSGLEVVASIRRRGLNFPVLVVTAHFEAEHAATAQYHGAEFLPKGAEAPRHLEAFSRRVREHGEGVRGKDQGVVQRLARARRLTQREAEIVALMVEDIPRREMAGRLGIRPDTLKTHVRSLLRKTHAASIAELGLHLRRVARGDIPERAGGEAASLPPVRGERGAERPDR